MHRYSFMRQKVMEKIDIPTYVKRRYGIEINSKSLSEDMIYKQAQQELDKALNRKYIDELYKIGGNECEKTKEIQYLSCLISNIIERISKVDFFILDLWADCLMGLLYSDENCKVEMDDKMTQTWNAENVEGAKKYYPYAKENDNFLKTKKIPGGCKEYHKVMISSEYISIFDIDVSKGNKNADVKKYGFPKSYDIYEKLQNAPIENLLLFEKTLGVGYVNQLFYYAKDFKTKSQLRRLEEVIKSCVGIPMFARKYITSKIWTYLNVLEYSDLSIQCAEEAGYLFASLIDEAYEAVLGLYWYAYYFTYWNNCLGNNILLNLESYRKQYFDEEEVYNSVIKNENIHDWRGIEEVGDCFYLGEDGYSIGKINVCDDKIEYIPVMVDDNEGYCLVVQAPINELGKDILEMTVWRLNEEIQFCDEIQDKMRSNIYLNKEITHYKAPKEENIVGHDLQEMYKRFDENNKELLDLFYKIRKDLFEKLKAKEHGIWSGKNIKASTEKVKPLHIYALMHANIVRLLNE